MSLTESLAHSLGLLFGNVATRTRLVKQALTVPLTSTQLQLSPGISVDLTSGTVIVTQALHLHCTERLSLTTDKDLILKSGCTPNPDRADGIPYSIFENCEEDEHGNPIVKRLPDLIDQRGPDEVTPCECSDCQTR